MPRSNKRKRRQGDESRFHHEYWRFRIVKIRFMLASLGHAPNAVGFERFLTSAGELVAWVVRLRCRPDDVLGEGFAIFDRSTWDEQAERSLFSPRFTDGIRVLFWRNDLPRVWDWMTFNRAKCFWPLLQLGATHMDGNDVRQSLTVFIPSRTIQPVVATEARAETVRVAARSRRPLSDDAMLRPLDEDGNDARQSLTVSIPRGRAQLVASEARAETVRLAARSRRHLSDEEILRLLDEDEGLDDLSSVSSDNSSVYMRDWPV